MTRALEVLNELCKDGVIRNYAIGGAMGALFYTEAILTMDLDVFVFFDDDDAFTLTPLAPIYKVLKEKGYGPDLHERECIDIEGTPVQFLPAYNPLLKEAVNDAVSIDYNGVATRVLTAEHLAAISVQTGRMKDKLRVQAFLNTPTFNFSRFETLLIKYDLLSTFKTWGIV
jgi:hypothetical protein